MTPVQRMNSTSLSGDHSDFPPVGCVEDFHLQTGRSHFAQKKQNPAMRGFANT